MKTQKLYSTFIALLFFISGVLAQGSIITAKQFVELKKNNKELVVVDASKVKLYTKSHIDGAVNIPYKSLNQEKGTVKGLIKPVEELAKYFGKKGISENDLIVIYDEGSQKYASRVFWVLKYLGAKNLKLLHKDNATWRNARIKLTSNIPKIKEKTFTPDVQVGILADYAFIKDNKSDIVLIDVRSLKEYTGADDVKKKYSKGHIQDAIHLNFKEVLQENKSFKSKEAFADIITKKGFTPDKTYVFYCKTGVKASVPFVFFKEVLGYPNVKVYDGAYLEWESLGELIEK